MKKTTLAGRVLAFLKGGDEAKVVRFEAKLERHFKDQIGIRTREIERLEDTKVDLLEALREAIPNVGMDKISNIGEVEAYVPKYVASIGTHIKAIHAIDDAIELQEEEISYLNNVRDAIYSSENELPEVPVSK